MATLKAICLRRPLNKTSIIWSWLHNQEASNEDTDVGGRRDGDLGYAMVRLSPWKHWKADHMLAALVSLRKEVGKQRVSDIHCLPLPESGKAV